MTRAWWTDYRMTGGAWVLAWFALAVPTNAMMGSAACCMLGVGVVFGSFLEAWTRRQHLTSERAQQRQQTDLALREISDVLQSHGMDVSIRLAPSPADYAAADALIRDVKPPELP